MDPPPLFFFKFESFGSWYARVATNTCTVALDVLDRDVIKLLCDFKKLESRTLKGSIYFRQTLKINNPVICYILIQSATFNLKVQYAIDKGRSK